MKFKNATEANRYTECALQIWLHEEYGDAVTEEAVAFVRQIDNRAAARAEIKAERKAAQEAENKRRTKRLELADSERLEMEEKVCTKCGESKPPSEYHKNWCANDGLHHHCKACAHAYYLNRKKDSSGVCRSAQTMRQVVDEYANQRQHQHRNQNLLEVQ